LNSWRPYWKTDNSFKRNMTDSRKDSTFYEGSIANTYDEKRFDSRAGQVIHNIEWAQLNAGLGDLSVDSKILEVGCGTGRFIEELVALRYTPIGIDPSNDMLDVCRKKLGDSTGVLFDRGEAGSLPYESDHFDFVYSIRVLNQVESEGYAYCAIKEMIRVAKPRGKVLIEYMDSRRAKLARRKVRLGKEWVARRHRDDTRLDGSDLERYVETCGARVIWRRGAFFLGMTAYYASPKFVLGISRFIDNVLSKCLPKFCSRCYILVEKGE
jgi:ubiquinone/menaquinone biosynthesis C-methylase UbiE